MYLMLIKQFEWAVLMDCANVSLIFQPFMSVSRFGFMQGSIRESEGINTEYVDLQSSSFK